MNAQIERNKQTVLAFYRRAFEERRPDLAIAEYAGADYIQHNPEVADGPAGFIAFIKGLTSQFPEFRLEIRRVIAEDNFVVLHFLARTTPDDRGTAGVDIFRLEQDRIVEHWDVLQPIPESSANRNGMV